MDNFSLLGDLVNNGYVSNTMRTINISSCGRHQWLGQDLLIMQNPNHGHHSDKFDYSAIAITKVVTYSMNYVDIFKIP